MNDIRQDLLSIGQFAGLTGLSLKALRLYAQLGLLVPAQVDSASGYRYYRAAQIHAARLIGLLRQMDMPLATVRQVVVAAPADADALVQGYLRQLESQLGLARHVAHEVSVFLQGGVFRMPFEVTVRTAPVQPVLSRITHTKVEGLSSFIRESIEQLTATAQAQGLASAGPPFGIYHGPINQDDDGPIEACLPVSTGGATSGDITARELPAAQLAVVDLQGEQCEFPHILGGYDAAFEWIARNGYATAGSPREVWIARDHMEVAWPFKPATS